MFRSPLAALLLLSLIWGGSYYFIKVLIQDFGPWTIVWFRSTVGLGVITVIMLFIRHPFAWKQMPWLPLAAVALVNMAIPWAIIGFSETRIASNLASILNATTPLCSLLLGILFFGTVSQRVQWVGMGTALTGVIVLLSFQLDSGLPSDMIGTLGMLAASIFYGLGSQLSKRFLQSLSAYQSALGTLFFAMLGSGIVALTTEEISIKQLTTPEHAASLIGLGAFGSGVAYILFYWIVSKGGAEYATMVTYLLPFSSLVWGWTMLNESIGWNLIVGLLLILSGIYIAGRRKLRTEKSLKLST
ncbi:DMT family transporter [Cohnella pontilimi]|uniref:DMT family transporter n=1 Tax=Cohnella pontilimi TaxID=2564100 RepID=A0A4U0FAH5_9BACL|nr:DMT family transporter [Cohnella pontilimi]TJY41528.1 DMT family transporter [Cohnella pontilimi]